VTFFPGNMALGKTATPSLSYEVGRAMARELRSIGINVNFAPVLDLAGDEPNPDLAIRAFGSDPTLASDMGAEMIRGLQEGGVSATARHFPGRGSGVASPRQVPVIPAARDALLQRDLVPFRLAIAGGTQLVMSANARYPALDADLPAMFSPKVVTDLLRREMGYGGVVVTEDLTSPAVLSAMSVEEAVVKALQAGNDLLLLGHDMDAQRQAVRGLKLATDNDRVSREIREKSQSRLQVLLQRKREAATFGLEEGE
jgi:beta-N-acetylhexosaminidase